MKILFDTSVIVAAIVETHPMHNRAFPWLKRAIQKEFHMFVACHTIAEVYGVLTTIPVSPKITPALALQLIQENIETKAEIISLTASDYIDIIKNVAKFNLSGGIIYDAIIAGAAQKIKADKLLTFNIKDFKRVWPDGLAQIISP